MRLILLLITAITVAPSSIAAQPQTSTPVTSTSSQSDTQSPATKGQADRPLLPVSLDKIREALEQPPGEPLRGLDERAQFHVEIRERQKLDDLLKSLNFKSGPAVPGGLYAYEQQRLLFPKVDNPLVQPYAAFNQSELVVVSLTTLIENYLAGRLGRAITAANRAGAEAAARQEVERAIAEYCAAQPNGGAGIQICTALLKP